MNDIDPLDRVREGVQSPEVTPPSPQLAAEVRRMSRNARREVWVRNGRKRWFAAGAATILLFGGGVSAAAAALQWHWWAADPDVRFTAVVPSGATCEYRIGNWRGAAPEVRAAVRAFSAEYPIVNPSDIERVLAGMQSGDFAQSMVPADDVAAATSQLGDLSHDTDFEFDFALSIAVNERITEYLRGEGIMSTYFMGLQSECGS